jgi:hypothetical protein
MSDPPHFISVNGNRNRMIPTAKVTAEGTFVPKMPGGLGAGTSAAVVGVSVINYFLKIKNLMKKI